MVDYDLAIIGISTNAVKLVSRAVKNCTRIAWIWDYQVKGQYLNISEVHHVLQQLISSLNNQLPLPSESLHSFATRLAPFLSKFELNEILESIPKSGVDVIVGKCKFQESRSNGYVLKINKTSHQARGEAEPHTQINSQINSPISLTASNYAIANDQPTTLPKIFGLAEHNYLTATQLLQLQDLPQSIAVFGDDPHACAIAQALNLLGVRTSLITNSLHILPEIDVAIARTLQAQLEAEGVAIYTDAKITAVSHPTPQRSKVWLDAQTLEYDRLLIPVAPRDFAIPRDRSIYRVQHQADLDLVLQKISARYSIKNSIQLGQAISGASSKPAITVVSTNPPLAQVGVTEDEVKAQNLKFYRSGKSGKSLEVWESASADWGFCKIICNRQGVILGASMVGAQAQMFIEAIAIAIQGKVKMPDLAILEGMEFTC